MSEAVLKRRIGFGLLTLYGVGVMVGAGIYVLVGQVAGATGTWAPVAFLIAGLIAVPTAISYAELSARIPESAGEAAYIRQATGSQALASMLGFTVAAVGVISSAAILQGGVGYLRAVVDLPVWLLVAVIGGLLVVAAILGVVESLALAAAFTLTEVVGLIIVVTVGFGAASEVAAGAPPGMSAMAAGALLAFFAFIGFEDMVNMAEETVAPERTMPRAIIAALAVTTLLYILVSWAAVRTVASGDLAGSERPLALVFETATGRGAGFLAIIAVAAALNGVLAQIVMAARVLFGLGRSSPLFRVFFETHPRFGTPVRATVLVGALVILLGITAPLVRLAEISSLVLLAVFCAINAALIALKARSPAAPDGFSAPVWVPYAGLALSSVAFVWGVLE